MNILAAPSRRCLPGPYAKASLKPDGSARRRRFRNLPQLVEAVDELLGAVGVVHAAGIPHVLVVETVEVVAAVEYDERVVEMARVAGGLADFREVPVALEHRHETGADALEALGLVDDHVEPVERVRTQELPQQIAARERVVAGRKRAVENPDDALGLRDQLVEHRFVLPRAFEALVFGVRQTGLGWGTHDRFTSM